MNPGFYRIISKNSAVSIFSCKETFSPYICSDLVPDFKNWD